MAVSSEISKILDNISSAGIYVIRADSYEILYFNERVRKVVPNITIGDKCYEAFTDSCENCPLKTIGDRTSNTTINFNDPFGQFVDIGADRIMWEDKIPAFIITVTEHRMLHEEAEIELDKRRLNLAVEEAYPVIISVNLTQNSYKLLKYRFFISDKVSPEGLYDDLMYSTLEVVHPDFKEKFFNTYDRKNVEDLMAKGDRDLIFEFRQLGTDHEYHWVSTQVIRIENPFNDDILLVFLNRAIDKQKELEQRLQNLLDVTVSNMTGFTAKFIVKGDNVYILEASDKFYEYFGTSPADYSKGLFWRIDNGEKARFIELARNNAAKHEPIEVVHKVLRKDGSVSWVKMSGSFIYVEKGYPVYHVVLVDISDIKQLQLDIEATYNSLPGGVVKFVVDDIFTVLEANRTFYKMTNADFEDENFGYFNHIYASDRDMVRDTIQKQSLESESLSIEYRIVSSDGVISWVHMDGQQIGMKNNKPVYQTVLMDITEQKKARLLLDMEIERYKAAVESSNDALFEYIPDIDELIIYQTTGDCKSENVYHDFLHKVMSLDITVEDDATRIAESVCSGHYRTAEARLRINSKDVKWYLILCMPIYENEKLIRVSGTFRDIDRIKKSEEEKQLMKDRYGTVISNIYHSIYELDYRNDIAYLLEINNKQFNRIRLPGNIYSNIINIREAKIHPDDRDTHMLLSDYQYCKSTFEKGIPEVYIEYRRLTDNGVYHWFGVSVRQADWDNEVFLLYLKDINKVKVESEEKQRILMDALAFAESASNAKTDFLSRMSHDMRTPMNAIIGMATIAQSSLNDKEKVADCIDKINSSSKFLLSLINDVLDMSKIESGKMLLSKQVFNFKDFINGILDITQHEASRKGIEFIVFIDDSVLISYEGDKLRIHQIVMNLLSNAMKFTDRGGRVSFRVYQTECTENIATLQFIVSDTGCGMESEFLERIFRPFEQGRDAIASSSGSGLGLSIARNLVNLMDGSINIESTPGKGSVFTVNIRVDVVIHQEDKNLKILDDIATRPDTYYDFKGKRALLAEDNEINIEIAKTLLSYRGMEVDVAHNGLEATEMFSTSEENYYSIIYMDIKMPVMDGLTATGIIREMNRFDAVTIPIAAMTANAFKDDVDNARAKDVNGYIVKPVLKYKLYAVTDILLNGGSCFDL